MKEINSKDSPYPYNLGNMLVVPPPEGCSYLLETVRKRISVEPNIFGARAGDLYWREEIVGYVVKEDGSTFHKKNFGNMRMLAKLAALKRLANIRAQQYTAERIGDIEHRQSMIQTTLAKMKSPKWKIFLIVGLNFVCLVLGTLNDNPIIYITSLIVSGVAWGIDAFFQMKN